MLSTLNVRTLPIAPQGKQGWPWTPVAEDSVVESAIDCPRLSILMPSYNQGSFIEQAIRSVLCQNYPNTELIVVDGGSTDNTVAIIKQYEPWIAYWVSEPDNGMSEALNKAYPRATGDLIGWQNTDDYYGPGSFWACARAAMAAPDNDIYHGRTWFVDADGKVSEELISGEFNLYERAKSFPLIGLPNQSDFIRRTTLGTERFVDESYECGMDTELLTRLILSGCKAKYVDGIIGYYRIHANAKTFAEGGKSAAEACRLCFETLQRTDVSQRLRAEIIKGFRKMLIALFRTGDADDFHRFAKHYLCLREITSVDLDLRGRMMISRLGPTILKAVMRQI
jgi:Glycosyltransferases involved in cell wall biogenesis